MAVPIQQPESPISQVTTDDIWAEDDDDYSLNDTMPSSGQSHNVGDIPKLRREHHNAGYLEGISTTKEKYLQEGFDFGYPSGATIGLQVGQILGTLQGLGLHDVERVARRELGPDQLFSHKFYDEKDELAKAKFIEAEGHPEVIRWRDHVKKLLEDDNAATLSI